MCPDGAIFSGIGNHDIFGLNPKSGVAPSDPEYGKRSIFVVCGS
jgi:hypothetical protein